MVNAVILGSGYQVPARVIANDFFVQQNPLHRYDSQGQKVPDEHGKMDVETSDEKIWELMGVKERRWAYDDEYVEDIGEKSARNALEAAKVSASDLEGIVVSTVTPHYAFPNTAQLIQERLDARNASYCLDVSAACAGFPYVLHIAQQRLKEKPGAYLVVAVETLSKITDPKDVSSPLYADGAGAVVLGPTNENIGLLSFYTRSDPFEGKWKYIIRDSSHKLRMPEGGQVLKLAVRGMVEAVHAVKESLGWTDADLSLVIPHQANLRIIEGIRKKLGFDRERVYMNIDRYANMSSATCAVALAECMNSGRIKKGDRVIVTSVGAGLTTSAYGIQF